MALLSLLDVYVGFGGPPVLDRLNLQIEAGERVCLLGRNGAGKTTLMRVAAGDTPPDSGTVTVPEGVRLARLTQEIPESLPGTVREIVAGGLSDADPAEDWEKDIRVDDLVSRLGLPEDRAFDDLSGGLKRRCLLARALACDPGLLLLDEPTTTWTSIPSSGWRNSCSSVALPCSSSPTTAPSSAGWPTASSNWTAAS